MNISLSNTQLQFTGPGGSLLVPDDDEVCRRLAMLIEGECEGLGPSKAAEKYGLTRQRYYQILADFYEEGAQSAYSDAVGHSFQSVSDSVPGLSDSFRSEATL
jgi:hypothetical protein